jgi:hypothetical protein
VAALLLACGTAAATPPAKGPMPQDPQVLARKIDEALAKRWATAKVEPAPRADDAEFLRRVYLDLAGRIPTAAEARAFLTDTRPDRRARLVEQLLASPRYAAHFANVWRAVFIPEANNNFIVRIQQNTFESWLKKQLTKNTGYDQIARELLTVPVSGDGPAAALALFGGGNGPSPLAFYSAKEFKAENLAASTARVFLGASVECAQCHNHPFADWKREQFWEFAAFFSGIRSQRAMDFLLPGREVPNQRELTIPGTTKVVQAKFLDGSQPAWKEKTSTRTTLGEWVTGRNNPYFARAATNRLWAYFLGTGLIEPVDEVANVGTANQSELLDLVAKDFAASGFDLKYLIRALTSTRAYHLSSAGTHKGQEDATLFARMPLRGLTPEQLFDSVATATGYRDSGSNGDDLASAITGGPRSARSEFLTKFGNLAERPVEAQTSILQALTLMNGKVIADATSLGRSETLAAVADAPFASTGDRVEALYLSTLSRRPTDRERDRAVRFVEDAVRSGGNDRQAYGNALADVFWALLNSSEFSLNH